MDNGYTGSIQNLKNMDEFSHILTHKTLFMTKPAYLVKQGYANFQKNHR